MSTVALQEFVKQGLLEKLESLVASLPQSLDDLAAAEQIVRRGVLELGRELLQQWSAVATAQVSAPECERCEEAMRHKGYTTGRVGETLGALGALHKSLRAVGKREALRKFIGYLKNNRERIDYPRYRALGLKVGSGQVESACKTLVGQRCKQAGMRNWTCRGAEGVLRLRAALQTGNFDQLWEALRKTAA